ncbi:hypothetical protein ACP70R_044081 [Stipagrostis hirtigluma subsp. patula]
MGIDVGRSSTQFLLELHLHGSQLFTAVERAGRGR